MSQVCLGEFHQKISRVQDGGPVTKKAAFRVVNNKLLITYSKNLQKHDMSECFSPIKVLSVLLFTPLMSFWKDHCCSYPLLSTLATTANPVSRLSVALVVYLDPVETG